MATSNLDVSVIVIATPAKALSSLQSLTDWAEDLYITYAWISSGGGQASHWQALPLSKVRRAVVGIHFAQTEPAALKYLAKRSEILKVINDTDGLFHPKLILGIKGDAARALVGSSNFTTGGFGGNTELNLLLQGSVLASPLADLQQFIDAQWHSARAFHPDAAWLAEYADAYAHRPKPPRVRSPYPPIVIQAVSELNIPWSRYYQLLARQEQRTLAYGDDLRIFEHPQGSYLQEVENCQIAFKNSPSFATMTLADRKLVAGWGNRTYGWFGRMSAAGEFKRMTAESPEIIAEHLDKIPLHGSVSEDILVTYLDGITAVHRIALATASRLLTVKRPDLFLSCNNANREHIQRVFGFNPRTTEHYLEIHRQLWTFPWYKSPEPDGIDERKAWHARVALVDALLYEG